MIVDQIKPPVSDACAAIVEMAADYSKAMFEKFGRLMPAIFFVKNGKSAQLMIPEMYAENKNAIAQIMHDLRKDSDCVVFATESWVTETKVPKGTDENKLRQMVETAPQPSEAPDRQEAIMLVVHVPNRALIILGKIGRAPDNVGNFECKMDNVESSTKMAGRFV